MTFRGGIPISDSTLRNENLHVYGEASESLHVAYPRGRRYARHATHKSCFFCRTQIDLDRDFCDECVDAFVNKSEGDARGKKAGNLPHVKIDSKECVSGKWPETHVNGQPEEPGAERYRKPSEIYPTLAKLLGYL